jgi:hypothetical protein
MTLPSRDRNSPGGCRSAIWALGTFPLFLLIFHFCGLFHTDTAHYFTGLRKVVTPRLVAGQFEIDPNVAITALDLGRRAALELAAGRLPLWNHFEGFGAPLLGEMQSAALFPPTFLLALPKGQALEHILLQLLGGIGAYLFLRKYGLGRDSALVGGALFELNGVFAWLQNAAFNPVALLPWILLGIEGLRRGAETGGRRETLRHLGLAAAATALAVYAGFPEETYLYAIFAAGWGLARCCGLARPQRQVFLAGLAAAALLGAALAAPALIAFLDYLPQADVSNHGAEIPSGAFDAGALLQFLMPYDTGPIFGTAVPELRKQWAFIGGYAGLGPVLCALALFLSPGRRSAAEKFLAGWTLFAVGATINLPVISWLFRLIPFVSHTMYQRYLNISWILCLIVLAAAYLERLRSAETSPRGRLCAASIALLAVVALVCAQSRVLVAQNAAEAAWLAGSLLAAAGVAVGFLALGNMRSAALLVSLLLVAEAGIFAAVPLLSYDRKLGIDDGPVAYLQKNAGLQRVFNFGTTVLRPNLGAYYGFDELNYDDIPAPRAAADYVRRHLDAHALPTLFRMNAERTGEPDDSHRRHVLERLDAYAAAGVKYIIAEPGEVENAARAAHLNVAGKLAPKYSDAAAEIYELSGVRPYFSAPGCRLSAADRDHLAAECKAPAVLHRLELAMPGWHGLVNGGDASLRGDGEIFQALPLPKGRSEVAFVFSPPGFGAAAVTALAALALLLLAVFCPVCRDREACLT